MDHTHMESLLSNTHMGAYTDTHTHTYTHTDTQTHTHIPTDVCENECTASLLVGGIWEVL